MYLNGSIISSYMQLEEVALRELPKIKQASR